MSGELRRDGGVLSHVIITDNKLTLELNKITEFPGVGGAGISGCSDVTQFMNVNEHDGKCQGWVSSRHTAFVT